MLHLVPAFFRSTPAVPELDFAGSIVVAGSAVPEGRGLIQGTRMFGSVSVSPHLGAGVGALGEYVVVEAESVARRPEGLAAEEAAGLPVAGCTALALVEKARLKRGDSVLVNGASGGIGTMVVQLVREAVGESGRVVAVCSGRNMELVKGLGANEVSGSCVVCHIDVRMSLVCAAEFSVVRLIVCKVVDYQAHSPVHQHLAAKYSNPRFSAVVDAFGVEELYLHCADYLGPGKPFVTVGIAFAEYTYSSMLYSVLSMLKCEFCPRILGGVPREYVRVTGIANLKDMEKLADLVECGKLRIVVDSCWGMEDANEVRRHNIAGSRQVMLESSG